MRNDLLTRMRKLGEQKLYQELYTDPLTGCLNRRALELSKPKFVAIIDLDSLKFINDTNGHRAGDQLLTALAGQLVQKFGAETVYRLSGDELVLTEEHHFFPVMDLVNLQREAKIFSFGFGQTLEAADDHLKEDKRTRELIGLRAPRGKEPPWYAELRGLWYQPPKAVS